MLGILYIILCIAAGELLSRKILFRQQNEFIGDQISVRLPVDFGVGTLFVTWVLYGVSYLIAVNEKAEQPLLWGNLILAIVAGVLILLFIIKGKIEGRTASDSRSFVFMRNELIGFSVLFLILLLLFFYVFQVRNGILYSGFTVFSDYAPHTAMIRSFSKQNNFPTQYPHFGGEDVKYHFMFQFLTANLEYLGMRIDVAYNVISALSMLGFLMLLYRLSIRITERKGAGVLAIVFFFLRSGLSFFRFVWEHFQAGDLLRTLYENTSFIGYTMNENWGLWCFNVYLNQRHLAFGLLIICIAFWVFLDWLEAGENHPETGLLWLGNRLFTWQAWKCRKPGIALFIGSVMGMCAFWNGAAVIGGLLILAGFAAFSDGKIDYAIMAAVTIVLSTLQSRFFMTTSAVQFSLHWGLLAYDTSFWGVLWFVLQISGVYFLGFAVLSLFYGREQRSIMFAFLLPLAFALTISLTPDISVNHKYVMLSYAMLSMFWGDALIRIWRKRHGAQVLAVALGVLLFATGIYDLVIVFKDNDRGHRIGVELNSPLTQWLDEHLDSSDLLLSPEYSIHEVTMAGVMLYNGWPYYAWSAGYNTDYRKDVALEIYTSTDEDAVKKLVEKEHISYILYEDGMKIDEQECYEDVISGLYPEVYTSENGRIRVYQVQEELG